MLRVIASRSANFKYPSKVSESVLNADKFLANKMPNFVEVLCNGYASMDSPAEEGKLRCVRANCSCVLITGNANVIVDTMTPWDGKFILDSLETRGIKPNDIDYVVSTHGHSDHIGNNNLFLKAKHIVGFCVSFQNQYFLHSFDQGNLIYISLVLQLIPDDLFIM